MWNKKFIYRCISLLFMLVGSLFYVAVIADKLIEFSDITFAILYPITLFLWGGLVSIPSIRAFYPKDKE